MKSLSFTVLFVGAVLFGSVCNTTFAADGPPSPYEYAIVKWDSPDRFHYNLPDSYKYVELRDQGVRIPKNAEEEEWCLAWVANEMAKTGWEPVTLHSRRILFRREKSAG